MNLLINGREEEISAAGSGMSVVRFLEIWSVDRPDMVSVELNGNIIYRAEYESTFLREGDKVEFLYFMGGGEQAYESQR